VVNINIGLLTPPMALCLYIASQIAKIPLEHTFKDVVPFLLAELGILALITYVPFISLILPSLFWVQVGASAIRRLPRGA